MFVARGPNRSWTSLSRSLVNCGSEKSGRTAISSVFIISRLRKSSIRKTMHSPIAYIALAFLLAIVGAALGALLGQSHKRLCALISLGAGTLLGVTAFAILPESFSEMSWWGLLLAFGSGYGLFFLIT